MESEKDVVVDYYQQLSDLRVRLRCIASRQPSALLKSAEKKILSAMDDVREQVKVYSHHEKENGNEQD